MVEPADARQEALGRVLGIEPGFDRVAGDAQFALFFRQFLAACDQELPFDQILAGNLLGHRMLDLEARVHLHEPDAVGAQALARVGDELDRPSALVIDRLRRLDRGPAHRGAGRFVHARRGRFLDHLLVAALERAIALEQMDDIAVGVAEHLHLDMARAVDPFFEEDDVIAERARRLALAAFERVLEVLGAVDLAHALAAAAGDRLDQHRIADCRRFLGQPLGALVVTDIAGSHRHARPRPSGSWPRP